jgi:hypothetical protein
LTVRELEPPLGPSQLRSESEPDQAGPYRLGSRICLRKQCELPFIPDHPFSSYCSDSCREAARRWSQRQANRRYRASEHGKACRRAQSCRYRQRVRERCRVGQPPRASGEGYQKPENQSQPGKFFCHRPGCHVRFVKTTRSPLQKFCSVACRQALRRVRLRDRWWDKILGTNVANRWLRQDFW